jgi:acyl homoserine lactone synthase
MINIFNFETAHHYGDAFPSLLKCRYKEFVGRQQYEVPSFNGMEYDQYDTPAAIYFAWKDGKGKVNAGMRAVPTSRPYMIKDLWPHTVKHVELPENPKIWEITRFFIDREIHAEQRREAHGEILCALLEFAIHCGITNYIGTAPPTLWNHTFRRCGWPAQTVGDETDIRFSEKIQTCMMDVSTDVLESVRQTMGISTTFQSNLALLDKNGLMCGNEPDRGLETKAQEAPVRRGLVRANGVPLQAIC